MMPRSSMAALCALAAAFIGAAVSVPAAEPAAPAKAENPLAKLPSAPGPHIEKIKALGDNSWLDLGAPAPDPKWGKEGSARGRSWGGRSLCSAPDLRGAFFCGTGVHGYIKTDGHYMDDLWFYDLNAHRWICLYPGASKETRLHLDKNGLEVNDRGEPIPVSYLSHAYGSMTYDSDLKKLVIIWSQCPWWGQAVPQRWGWLDQRYKAVKEKAYGHVGPVIEAAKHPLFWDVATGKWERRFVDGPGPYRRQEAWSRVTEYIPSMKKTFHGGWLYDHTSNSWTQVRDPQEWIGHNGCYDSRRERVYSALKERFVYFDLKTGKWMEVKAKGQPEDFGDSNNGRLTFDAASARIVWHPTDAEKGNIRVHDPEADSWEQPERTFPKGKSYANLGVMVHGFYDPGTNAHFYYLAGDSCSSTAPDRHSTAITMLVYRYKNAKK